MNGGNEWEWTSFRRVVWKVYCNAFRICDCSCLKILQTNFSLIIDLTTITSYPFVAFDHEKMFHKFSIEINFLKTPERKEVLENESWKLSFFKMSTCACVYVSVWQHVDLLSDGYENFFNAPRACKMWKMKFIFEWFMLKW